MQAKDQKQEEINKSKYFEIMMNEEKRQKLREENERKRAEKHEKDLRSFHEAIEFKKRELQEKLELRQKIVFSKEA